jgi:hypothetical protein
MCRRVDCPSCGRPTYAGCGLHIEQVLGDVPPVDRCRCREQKSGSQNNGQDGGQRTKPAASRSWLRSLLGKD